MAYGAPVRDGPSRLRFKTTGVFRRKADSEGAIGVSAPTSAFAGKPHPAASRPPSR